MATVFLSGPLFASSTVILGAISAFTGDDVAYGAQIAGGAVDYGLVAVDLEVGEQVLDGLGLLEDGAWASPGRASTDTVMVF